MRLSTLACIGTFWCFSTHAASAQTIHDARSQEVTRRPLSWDDIDLSSLEALLSSSGQIDSILDRIRALGMLVFTTPFTKPEGYGDGPFDPSEIDVTLPGHRPTLQGNRAFLRVNGLDAQSCNECHTIVRHGTTPPTLGIGGVGGLVNTALILPSLIDVGDSTDDRVAFVPGHEPDLPLQFDGVADYNGRFANPPFLFGGGGVELLGKEMTADLQQLLKEAQLAPAGTITQLDTHGVHFGSITTLDDFGNIEMTLEGIGPEDPDSVTPEEALVVRPFGRKGENFSMRDFDRGAMQFHFGIQPVEVVGQDVDDDGDGVVNEVTEAEMTTLHVFDVTNPKPIMDPLDQKAAKGLQWFKDIGCAECHRPQLTTEARRLPLAHPEVPTDPSANVYARIDLLEVGFEADSVGSGVVVPLFADLKRHKMGSALAEHFERGEIANDEFTTARLWGIADTAPYLHDGRATTLQEAIEFHGGEAQPARDAFVSMKPAEKEALLAFLGSLRTPENPNQELVDLVNR